MKIHWENIYQTKSLQEVSWYQPIPQTSLDLIADHGLPKTARIIDVGGGDSFLVDHLLNLGYQQITVLDISEAALSRAQARLGPRADAVTWIACDIRDFVPQQSYDCWHDRAAFHFLTATNDIHAYSKLVARSVGAGGYLILGTFSEQGPTKCSGITIQQYSPETMQAQFGADFMPLQFLQTDHPTPFGTHQNFVFGAFERRK
ncbi:MAG: class I SAM-dependent methyltransferase [Bernardetiaceae bacterium]